MTQTFGGGAGSGGFTGGQLSCGSGGQSGYGGGYGGPSIGGGGGQHAAPNWIHDSLMENVSKGMIILDLYLKGGAVTKQRVTLLNGYG